MSFENKSIQCFDCGATFDFTVEDGLVRGITFRAAPETLARVVRRDGGRPRG